MSIRINKSIIKIVPVIKRWISIFSVTNKSTKDMVYAVDRMAGTGRETSGGWSRNIQRLTRACWDAENRKNLLPFLGRDMPIRVPK